MRLEGEFHLVVCLQPPAQSASSHQFYIGKHVILTPITYHMLLLTLTPLHFGPFIYAILKNYSSSLALLCIQPCAWPRFLG